MASNTDNLNESNVPKSIDFNRIKNICKNKITRIGKKISHLTIVIPDRTKIFLSALWFWAYIMFYCTKLFNCILGVILVYTPDSIIIYKPPTVGFSKKGKHEETPKPTIIEARHGADIITNKMKAVVNLKWDSDIYNDNVDNVDNVDNDESEKIFGGLNVKDVITVFPKLTTAVVWISYLFEIDKKISEMNDEDLGKNIKYMLINFTDRAIYRSPDLHKSERAKCGEIPF